MISVIVPFKDAEPWIKRCADSLHDNAGDFEFIFIDDHSVDSSKDIVAGYDDDRFVVVDNRHRPGVSGARNTGIDVARGSWITFLDADDVMLPNAAKKFNKMLKTKSDIHQSNHSRRYRTSGRTVTKYKNK
jgi:glycosyltransferase involved in cell wall biosynthesis